MRVWTGWVFGSLGGPRGRGGRRLRIRSDINIAKRIAARRRVKRSLIAIAERMATAVGFFEARCQLASPCWY